MTLTLEEAEAIVGEPATTWVSRCYEIAHKLAPEVGGEAVYGHWRGDIAPGTHFAPRAFIGWVSHGWIVMPDGTVIDPTQWAFFGDEPYIFYGEPGDDYDRGGQRLREEMLRPPPDYHRDADQFDCGGLTPDAEAQVGILLGDSERPWSFDQLRWLANLPLPYFNGYETEVYEMLKSYDLGAWIPLDNQIAAGVAGNDDEFICERCGEDTNDTSYQPLCPDCYHETEGRA